MNIGVALRVRTNHFLQCRGLQTSYIAMEHHQHSIDSFGPQLKQFIEEKAKLCKPESIHICDGSAEENERLVNEMIADKMMKRLPKYEDW